MSILYANNIIAQYVLLPSSIKLYIMSYLSSVSALHMRSEINRCIAIVNQPCLREDQTIWSIMSIDWYYYYTIDKTRYRNREIKTPKIVCADLTIAKHMHIIYSYNWFLNGCLNERDQYILGKRKKEHELMILRIQRMMGQMV